MKFLEKDLEKIIFEADLLTLCDRGFCPTADVIKTFRQLRIGNYGILDILYVSKEYDISVETKLKPCLIFTVCELKKDRVSVSTFLQAVRYAKGIESFLKKRKFSFEFKVNISLVGSSIDNSDFIYLSDLIPDNFLSCHTYSYDVDGIRFKHINGYSLRNEGFYIKNEKPF